MRSFWSDLEKQQDSRGPPSSPNKLSASSRVSPLIVSSSKFADNPFLQSNSSSPPRPQPVFQNQYHYNHSKKQSDSSIDSPDLSRKSSLTRNGTFGRLHGPRNLGNNSQSAVNTSPSKLKKVVTFDHTDQVIQYEMQTPDLSSDSQSLEGTVNSEDEDDDDDIVRDDDEENVPVIEPLQNYPSSPQHRPLPQIPQSMSSPSLFSHDGQFPSLPAPTPTPTVNFAVEHEDKTDTIIGRSKLSLEQRLDIVLDKTSDDATPVSSPQPSTLYPVGSSSLDILQDTNYPSPSVSSVYSDNPDYDLDDEPFSLVRKESLLDHQRKLLTKNHISNMPLQYATEPSAAQVQRSMSQKRRSIVKVLEERSKGKVGVITEMEEEDSGKVAEQLPDLAEVREDAGDVEEKEDTEVRDIPEKSHDTTDGDDVREDEDDVSEDAKEDQEHTTDVQNTPEPPLLPSSFIPYQLDQIQPLDNLDFEVESPILPAIASDAGSTESSNNDAANDDFYTPRESATSTASRDSYLAHSMQDSASKQQEEPSEQEDNQPTPSSSSSSTPTPTAQSTSTSPDLCKEDSINTIRDSSSPPLTAADEVASLNISTGHSDEIRVKIEPDDEFTKVDTPRPLPDIGISPMFGETFHDEILQQQTEPTSPPTTIVKREPVDDLPIRRTRPGPPSQPLPPVPSIPVVKQEEQSDSSPVPSLEQPQPYQDSPESLSYSPVKNNQSNANIFTDLPRWSTDLEGDRFNMPSVASEFASEFSDLLGKDETSSKSLSTVDASTGKENQTETEQEVQPEEHQPTEEFDQSKEPDQSNTTIRSSSGSKLRARPSLTPLDVARISRSRSNASQTSVKREDGHILREITRVPVPVPVLQLDSDDFNSDKESIFGDINEEFDKLLHVKKVR